MTLPCALSCDLFCAVVDNLGDAGIAWRLARQLAVEKGWRMRLWIDDSAPLALLRPGVDAAQPRQDVDGVEIRRWSEPFPEIEPADIVIEAFACELPEAFVVAMAARPRPPVWINLEYLSAEDWVAGCHGLASPHPRLPLTKYFFFPGFGPGTGGLIHESSADFGRHGIGAALGVSLFCYDNPVLPLLLDTWADGAEPVACRVADGLPRCQVAAWLDEPFAPGDEARRGALALTALPFLPQPDYDRLLGGCDLNFVRGEDSFVRAQWAERPFVWQPYPQADGVHRLKLEAFLSRYGDGLIESSDEAAAVQRFWRAWNGTGDVDAAWPAFRAALPRLFAHAGPWAGKIAATGDLATNLETFCRARL
ncbi:MAG: elongation factor P maturation arginine rhamnosyltransferase EarP [Rhodocyclaceae bacterium]|nr:elongation factor P maturation arginine rhamnosyltransferase EarP [Rhodocyclaceae bacterium]